MLVRRPFNPSTAEAEAGGSQILAQCQQHTETLSQKKGQGRDLSFRLWKLKSGLYMLFTLAWADYRNQGPNL